MPGLTGHPWIPACAGMTTWVASCPLCPPNRHARLDRASMDSRVRGNDTLGGVMPRLPPSRHARPDRASMDSRVRGNDNLGGVMPRLPLNRHARPDRASIAA